MSQSNSDTVPFLGFRLFKPSYRSLPEQAVGLGLFLTLSLSIGLFTQLLQPIHSILYSSCVAFAMWVLWRRNSLRALKLELSLFLSQFALQILWSFSTFIFQQSLLSLIAILLLWFNTLLGSVLYWKKERLSGAFLTVPLLLILYLVGVNYLISLKGSLATTLKHIWESTC